MGQSIGSYKCLLLNFQTADSLKPAEREAVIHSLYIVSSHLQLTTLANSCICKEPVQKPWNTALKPTLFLTKTRVYVSGICFIYMGAMKANVNQ